MSELMTLEKIEESKIYQCNGVTFRHPLEVASPFLKAFGEQDLYIQTDKDVVNVNDDGSKNISYGRVLIQKVFGQNEVNTTVGMIIAFDNLQVKLFAGAQVSACTNLCVFNSTWLINTKITSRLDSHINYMENLVLGDGNLNWNKTIEEMVLSKLHRDAVHKLHSQFILEHKKTKDKALYGESFTNKAFGDILMEDSKSPYVMEGNYTSEWNVYNALTQQISDSKDILYAPSKSLEAYDMIKNLTIN